MQMLEIKLTHRYSEQETMWLDEEAFLFNPPANMIMTNKSTEAKVHSISLVYLTTKSRLMCFLWLHYGIQSFQ